MEYVRHLVESEYETIFHTITRASKQCIDADITDYDTLHPDLEAYFPRRIQFRSREEAAEYTAIVRKWNARAAAELEDYLEEQKAAERRASERRRSDRERKEAEERRNQEEERRRREREEEGGQLFINFDETNEAVDNEN